MVAQACRYCFTAYLALQLLPAHDVVLPLHHTSVIHQLLNQACHCLCTAACRFLRTSSGHWSVHWSDSSSSILHRPLQQCSWIHHQSSVHRVSHFSRFCTAATNPRHCSIVSCTQLLDHSEQRHLSVSLIHHMASQLLILHMPVAADHTYQMAHQPYRGAWYLACSCKKVFCRSHLQVCPGHICCLPVLVHQHVQHKGGRNSKCAGSWLGESHRHQSAPVSSQTQLCLLC